METRVVCGAGATPSAQRPPARVHGALRGSLGRRSKLVHWCHRRRRIGLRSAVPGAVRGRLGAGGKRGLQGSRNCLGHVAFFSAQKWMERSSSLSTCSFGSRGHQHTVSPTAASWIWASNNREGPPPWRCQRREPNSGAISGGRLMLGADHAVFRFCALASVHNSHSLPSSVRSLGRKHLSLIPETGYLYEIEQTARV